MQVPAALMVLLTVAWLGCTPQVQPPAATTTPAGAGSSRTVANQPAAADEQDVTPAGGDAAAAQGETSPEAALISEGTTGTPPAETGNPEQPPTETAPAETAAAEGAATETAMADTPPAEAAPAETAPAETTPAETAPQEQPAAAAPGEKVELTDQMLVNRLVDVPGPLLLGKPAPVADADAKDEAGMKSYTEEIPGASVKFDMVPIKGGKYMMGSADGEEARGDDEGPQHEVEVEPFWMGKYEVTWGEYELWGLGLDMERRRLTSQEPGENDPTADAIAIPTKPYSDMTNGMGKEGFPAICMTQFAAKMYCKWLSAKTGRYYRLPTEAEWEYACRAGTDTPYSFGDDADKLDDYAWYFDNADDKYQKVGQKKPNPWGLYDMHGNVSEWVVDQYVPDFYKQFAGKPVKEPLALATTIYPRVVRGGSWTDDPEVLRSAARVASNKGWKMQDPQIPQSIWYHTDAWFVGFRVVRPLRVPSAEEAKRYEVDDIQLEEYKDYRLSGKE